jgi:hypothetical protein
MFRNGMYETVIEHYLDDGKLFAKYVVKCSYKKSENFIIWWIAVNENIVRESRVKVENENDAIIRGEMYGQFMTICRSFA